MNHERMLSSPGGAHAPGRLGDEKMKSETVEKAARIAAQWPKNCGCGRVYDLTPPFVMESALEWNSLPLKGNIVDEFATIELRNCACNSTLAVITTIHDLAAE